MRTLTTTCAAVAFLGLGLRAPDRVSFEPAEGLSLFKLVTVDHELNLDRLAFSTHGNQPIPDAVGGWLTSNVRQSIQDDYLSVADGRPQVLRRTYRKLAGKAQLNVTGARGKVDDKTTSSSPLQGKSVLFTWIEDEGEYARTYDYLDGEEELLRDLAGDVDLLALLPPGEVSEGDTWPLDAAGLRDVLAPGGDVRAVPDEEGYFARSVEVGTGGDLADVLSRDLAGGGTATYLGVRDVEGRRLAAIAVELSVVSTRDRTRAYGKHLPADERREARQLKSVIVDYTLEGSGELLWDLEGGHFESFVFEGQETFATKVTKRESDGRQTYDVSEHTQFSGQLNMEYSIRKKVEDN